MGKYWFTANPILKAIGSVGDDSYSFTDAPEGSTLLRTIIHVWAFGWGSMPDPLVQPHYLPPVAWVLTEINSEVNPTAPLIGPWGGSGPVHEVAQGMLEMGYAPMSTVHNVPGNSTPGIGGTQSYIFNPEVTDMVACWGNGRADSHAQRKFTRGDASFIFECKSGPLASWINDVEFTCVATIRHLIDIP